MFEVEGAYSGLLAGIEETRRGKTIKSAIGKVVQRGHNNKAEATVYATNIVLFNASLVACYRMGPKLKKQDQGATVRCVGPPMHT